MQRRRGIVSARRIDLSRVALFRDADHERLADAQFVEHELVLRAGLNDDAPYVYPRELASYLGNGLRAWQYPCQLAPYLVFLSTQRIRRYMEIGVQHGGTFVTTVEYLDRFCPIERALAVDVLNVHSLYRYERMRRGARFVRQDTASQEFARTVEREEPFDLVLIDGDHSYAAVRADWELIRPHTRIVAFHDIVDHLSPGVVQLWSELRSELADEYDLHEFADQYAEVQRRDSVTRLGIGVAVRRSA
jgi:cephalosporin hydroxylase